MIYKINETNKKFVVEFCILTSRISDYPLISQGKTRIPGVNDGEDFELTDVSVLAFQMNLPDFYLNSNVHMSHNLTFWRRHAFRS